MLCAVYVRVVGKNMREQVGEALPYATCVKVSREGKFSRKEQEQDLWNSSEKQNQGI